jgi:hypothetical protein
VISYRFLSLVFINSIYRSFLGPRPGPPGIRALTRDDGEQVFASLSRLRCAVPFWCGVESFLHQAWSFLRLSQAIFCVRSTSSRNAPSHHLVSSTRSAISRRQAHRFASLFRVERPVTSLSFESQSTPAVHTVCTNLAERVTSDWANRGWRPKLACLTEKRVLLSSVLISAHRSTTDLSAAALSPLHFSDRDSTASALSLLKHCDRDTFIANERILPTSEGGDSRYNLHNRGWVGLSKEYGGATVLFANIYIIDLFLYLIVSARVC